MGESVFFGPIEGLLKEVYKKAWEFGSIRKFRALSDAPKTTRRLTCLSSRTCQGSNAHTNSSQTVSH